MAIVSPSFCPFKGLVPYEEDDFEYFKGRKDEREIIRANLLASRLTVVFGDSGVGKSSVLRAGVAHDLRKEAEAQLGNGEPVQFVAVVFANWRDDPTPNLLKRIDETIEKLGNGRFSIDALPQDDLVARIEKWTQAIDGHVLLILDQFEDLFFYHPDSSLTTHGFGAQLGKLIANQTVRANVILAVRADELSRLDRLTSVIPNVLGNCLEVDHLTRESAKTSIVEPLRAYQKARAARGEKVIEFDEDLPDVIIGQLASQSISFTEAETAKAEVKGREDRIEAPYLQLVMTRLWRQEVDVNGSDRIRTATLKKLGGTEKIVQTHLDVQLSRLSFRNRRLLAKVFPYLVTPSGRKIAQSVGDLATTAKASPKTTGRLLRDLGDGENRIVRSLGVPLGEQGGRAEASTPSAPGEKSQVVDPRERFEIFHDVLAAAVLKWLDRRSINRRAVGFLLVFISLGLVMAATAWYTDRERRFTAHIQRERIAAQAEIDRRKLEARAQIERDLAAAGAERILKARELELEREAQQRKAVESEKFAAAKIALARQHATEQEKVNRELKDQLQIRDLRDEIRDVRLKDSDYREAKRLIEEIAARARKRGLSEAERDAWKTLGDIFVQRGPDDEALAFYEAARKVRVNRKNLTWDVELLIGIGNAQKNLSSNAEATTSFRTAANLSRDNGLAQLERNALSGLAETLEESGDTPGEIAARTRLRELLKPTSRPAGRASEEDHLTDRRRENIRRLAELQRQTGAHASAMDAYREVLAMSPSVDVRLSICDLLKGMNRPDDLRALLQEQPEAEITRSPGPATFRNEVLTGRYTRVAGCWLAAGDEQLAQHRAAQALDQLKQIKTVRTTTANRRTLTELEQTLRKLNRPDDAQYVAQRLPVDSRPGPALEAIR